MDIDKTIDNSFCLDEVLYHLKEVVGLLCASDCEFAGNVAAIKDLIFQAESEKRECDIAIAQNDDAENRMLNRQYKQAL